MESAATLLSEAVTLSNTLAGALAPAERVVTDPRGRELPAPGIGHPLHKPVDPRVPRLFEMAERNGSRGKYVASMEAIAEEVSRLSDRSLHS